MTRDDGRALVALVLFGVAAALLGSRAGADAAPPWIQLPGAGPGVAAARLDPVPAADSPPVELEVPAIALRAGIVPVGRRPDGAAQTPAAADVGWWRLGAAPGARGSAVLLGHRDTATAPAVFARLPELRPGHAIGVRRADGIVIAFVVRATSQHDKDALPRAIWQASGGRALLRLVTCGGPFDELRDSYRQNVIVHAEALGALPASVPLPVRLGERSD